MYVPIEMKGNNMSVMQRQNMQGLLNAFALHKRALQYREDYINLGFSLQLVKEYWVVCIGSGNEMKDINLWPDTAKDFLLTLSQSTNHICKAVEVWSEEFGEHKREKRDDIFTWLDDVLIAGHLHPDMSLSVRIPKIIGSVHECAQVLISLIDEMSTGEREAFLRDLAVQAGFPADIQKRLDVGIYLAEGNLKDLLGQVRWLHHLTEK